MNNNNRQIRFGGGGGGGAEQQQQHHSQHLGVNRIGKSIRKSPNHQSNFSINPNSNNKHQQQNPQPRVYNINKNDFRNIVQQLTGTPTRDSTPDPTPVPSVAPPPRPTNTPTSPSMRLHRIRPPPLAPIARPAMPMPMPIANPSQNPNPNLAFYPRAPPAQAPAPVQPNSSWANTADSPVSVYMRYLENSILNPQAQLPPYGQQNQRQLGQQPLPSSGLLPMPVPAPQQPAPIEFRSPATTGPPLPAAMPSPSAFLNLFSPRSPYPSLSPRFQVPPPLSPTFMLSPLPQSGGLLGSFPQPLPSPGFLNFWSPRSPYPSLSPTFQFRPL